MSFAELGRTIIKNNANALWQKPFLRKFKNSYVYETYSKTLRKPFHKKANPEQIILIVLHNYR